VFAVDITVVITTATSLVCGWVYNRSKENQSRVTELEKTLDNQIVELAQIKSILSERKADLESLKVSIAALSQDVKTLIPVPSMITIVKDQLEQFVPRQELEARFRNVERLPKGEWHGRSTTGDSR
jgi:hypothetical protein